MEDLANSPIKIVKCRNCGADVVVNANYPIDAVNTCIYCPSKNDKNL
jgi:hypothetical protein|tara:strand:- start:314 stop:454 length:141 start_codon:yes stop_codon:yes gene_type:complete